MSVLGQALEDYLRLRRALGFKLQRHGRLLPSLVAHLESAGAATLTTQLALTWATAVEGKPGEWAIRLSIARGFAAYLQSLDPATEVPPADLLPRTRRRASPYLYTEAEIAALMNATRTLRFPLNRATYNTVIGLLATTGMRIGELITLDRDDLDREQQTLLVRNAKFADTRLLPLHNSAADALGAYAGLRDELCPHPATPAFFVSTAGTRLAYANVYATFQHLVRTAGLQPRSERCHPRLHDFRHRMVVVTLTDWYRRGADVAALLPALSTYLGHTSPAYTFWYVSAAPELLALAAARLEHARGAGHDPARPNPGGLLHAAADRPAPGQPAHRGLLPGRLQAAAGLRRTADRQAAVPAAARRPRRQAHRRLPGPPRDRARQRRPHPQRPPRRDPLPVPLRGLRHPSTPPSSARSWPSRPGAATAPSSATSPPDETDALLAAPDRARWLGRRDHALLLVAVQTGLRVSELTGLTRQDVPPGHRRRTSAATARAARTGSHR